MLKITRRFACLHINIMLGSSQLNQWKFSLLSVQHLSVQSKCAFTIYQFICFNFLLKYQEIIQICGTQFLWVTLSMKFIHLNYQIWCLFIIIIKSKSKKLLPCNPIKKITTHMKNQIFWFPKIWMIKQYHCLKFFWKLLFLSIHLIIVA